MTNNTYKGIFIYSLSNNNSIDGNTVTNNGDGIKLDSSSSNRISGNTIINNSWGIQLGYDSSNNSISKNNVSNNDYGIALISSSNYNRLSENTITNSRIFGILLSYSSNNNCIDENNIANSTLDGILLSYSANNSIIGNDIANNYYDGIKLDSSSNNSISGNAITDNDYGIWLVYSSNNFVYRNNFVDNIVQVNSVTPEYASSWDNGCEGNFWSNYNGTDLDGDGVGDTFLPWEGVDNYPLMNLYWSPCDISHDLKVDMRDIGVSARAFGTIPGDALWNPHADITGQEPLVADGKVDMRDIARHFGEHYS
jgi:parallel beta-helix repeat protein